MNIRLMKRFLTLSIAFLVIACGGGGGGGGVAGGGGTQPGIDRLGVTGGVVSGFGSIFVNGVEFETDSAEFGRGTLIEILWYRSFGKDRGLP